MSDDARQSSVLDEDSLSNDAESASFLMSSREPAEQFAANDDGTAVDVTARGAERENLFEDNDRLLGMGAAGSARIHVDVTIFFFF